MSLPTLISPGAVTNIRFVSRQGTAYTPDSTGHVTPLAVADLKDLLAAGYSLADVDCDVLTTGSIVSTLTTTQAQTLLASLAPLAALSTTQTTDLATLAPIGALTTTEAASLATVAALTTAQIASLASIPAPTTTSSQALYMHADGSLHLGS